MERCGGLDSFYSEQWLVGSYVNKVMQEVSWLVELPKTVCCVDRSKSFHFGCVQICKCLWLLYGEVGKHISVENVHSETIVWHFITIFGFCMIIVSPNCKWASRWCIFWSRSFAVRTPHTISCLYSLLCYECTLMPSKHKSTLNSTRLRFSTSRGEHRIYSQVLTLYMSAYL